MKKKTDKWLLTLKDISLNLCSLLYTAMNFWLQTPTKQVLHKKGVLWAEIRYFKSAVTLFLKQRVIATSIFSIP